MTTNGERIYSNLAIPPGEGLLEEIKCRGISPPELAAMLGLSVDAMNEVFAGDRAITPDIAVGLSNALGISAQFWLNGEALYRATIAHNWEKTGAGRRNGQIGALAVCSGNTNVRMRPTVRRYD